MLYNSNDLREMIKNDLNFKTLTLERKSQLNEAIENWQNTCVLTPKVFRVQKLPTHCSFLSKTYQPCQNIFSDWKCLQQSIYWTGTLV